MNKNKTKVLLLVTLLFASALTVFPSVEAETPNWWHTGWGYRILVEVNSSYIDGDLTNYPLMLKIINNASMYEKVNDTTGTDIVFVDFDDNTTQYAHEIEYFNHGGGVVNLVAWVNVTSVTSATNKKFWIYYYNATAGDQQDITGTWDSDYLGVWHMHQASGNLLDSTSGDNDMTATNTPTYQNTSDMGLANGFSRTDMDGFDFDSWEPLSDNDFTIEVWNSAYGFHSNNDATSYDVFLAFDHDRELAFMQRDNGEPGNQERLCVTYETDTTAYKLNFTTTPDAGNLHNYVLRWDYGEALGARAYYDSTETAVNTAASLKDRSSGQSAIGGQGVAADGFAGTITEVRFSNVLRSTDYINATYDNVENYDTFLTFGKPEAYEAPEGPGETDPVNSNPTPTNESTISSTTSTGRSGLDWQITVADPNGDTMDIYFRTNTSQETGLPGSTWRTFLDPGTQSTLNDATNDTYGFDISGDIFCTHALTPNTRYFWSVNTTDGTNWDNDTYWFRTNNTYTWTLDKTANVSTVTPTAGLDQQLVNYTITIENTGTGEITDVSINETWLNCSCSDWKFYLVDTNFTEYQFFNDSCYMSINISNITGGSTVSYYLLVNITECANATTGTVTNTATVTGTYASPASDHHSITWDVASSDSTGDNVGEVIAPVIGTFAIFMAVLAIIGAFVSWMGKVIK